MIKVAEWEREFINTGVTKREKMNRHVEQRDDFVCRDEGEHLRLHLTFDEKSAKGQNGHWTRLKVVITSDAQGLGIISGANLGHNSVVRV